MCAQHVHPACEPTMWAKVGTQKVHITSAHCGLRLMGCRIAPDGTTRLIGNDTVNGTNVQLWEGGGPCNEWIIEPVTEDNNTEGNTAATTTPKYISSGHCGLRLNTADGNKKNIGWTNVQLWEGAGPGNEWIIEPVPGSDDKKYITSAHSGLRLNTDGTTNGPAINGTNVKLWEKEGPPPIGNEWIITGAGVVEPPKTKSKTCILL